MEKKLCKITYMVCYIIFVILYYVIKFLDILNVCVRTFMLSCKVKREFKTGIFSSSGQVKNVIKDD